MSVAPLTRIHAHRDRTTLDVEIVIPVYNEAEQLAASVTALRAYLDHAFPFSAMVTIADNASTDDTWSIAASLATELSGVQAIHLDQKGRGRALKAAWSRSSASVVAYMDVDLATGLDALLPLVAPLLSGHSDVAIGTRLGPGAHVVRGARREVISRSYNLLLRSTLRSTCSDAQCGFKAMRREAASEVLPLVEDDEWFFDTEVLVTAQRVGLRIHEVPVDWVDDMDSRVEVLHTAVKDLRGMWRLLGRTSRQKAVPRPDRSAPAARMELSDFDLATAGTDVVAHAPLPPYLMSRPPEGDRAGRDRGRSEVSADELLRFAGVGAVSTVAYAALFAALEPSLGGYTANTVAIVLCSLGNTAAHRGMAGAAGRGLGRGERMATAATLMGVSMAFTSGALAATRALGLTSLTPELCAVTIGNVGAAVIRFGILRTWVFQPEFGTHLPSSAEGSGHLAGGARPTPLTTMP